MHSREGHRQSLTGLGMAGTRVSVAIGASTGGPKALLRLVADLRLPQWAFVFLVQHIHPKFSAVLARRLGEVSAVPVLMAGEGVRVEPGRVYLGPGGRHLLVERAGPAGYRTRLTEDPPRHGVRPSVDVLFGSVAEAFGSRAVGVVLTGMGRDGLAGAREIKARGGTILAEAEETCVVYGMPRVLAEAGLTDRLVPIQQMATAIQQACATLAERLPDVPAARAG